MKTISLAFEWNDIARFGLSLNKQTQCRDVRLCGVIVSPSLVLDFHFVAAFAHVKLNSDCLCNNKSNSNCIIKINAFSVVLFFFHYAFDSLVTFCSIERFDHAAHEGYENVGSEIGSPTYEEFERPPLRHIDKYMMPRFFGLSARYTVSVMAMVGFIISFGMKNNVSTAKLARSLSGVCCLIRFENVILIFAHLGTLCLFNSRQVGIGLLIRRFSSIRRSSTAT